MTDFRIKFVLSKLSENLGFSDQDVVEEWFTMVEMVNDDLTHDLIRIHIGWLLRV